MRLALLCFCLVFFLSCQQKIPKDILPREKMQAVMWDIVQVDEMIDYYIPSDTSFRQTAKRQGLYQQVYAIHKISRQQYEKSYAWYVAHPAELKVIIDSLQSSAERKLQQVPDSTRPQAPKIDSNFKKKGLLPRGV